MKDFFQAVVYAGAFLVVFIPLMVTDSMFFPYITGKNFAFRILVEIIFSGWIILALLDVKYRPRFSWVMASGGVLLVVMFFANILGEYPHKSFWSNFERMDGYVTLVHFFLYFVVLGHILQTKKMWSYFLHTSIAVASYVAIYGLGQSAGVIEGRNRVDSTLGNAAYMAVYMLFHIFMLLLVMMRSKDWFVRALYGLVLVLFVYILMETGTRGTFIGFVGGISVALLYMMVFGRTYPGVRKAAIGGIIALVGFMGIFLAFGESSFVKNNVALDRITDINLEKDLVVRSTIWNMAYEGIEERPVLGWGQGNFNYVFNNEYDPSLYAQESWFDRVHNIFFDWLIAGGILGFIAYFGILGSCLFYLFWRPLFRSKDDTTDEAFTVIERAILIGVLAGYFVHNLVVFDNIVSYMFYAVILAFIHSRVSTEMPSVMKFSVHKDVLTTVVTPIILVATGAVVYFTNVPAMFAAQDIIDAFRAQDVEERFAQFQEALDRDSFARQEIVEQIAQQAMSLAGQANIAAEVKEPHLKMAERELIALTEDKPGDARLHVFFASFYKSVGQQELAKEQIDIARELTPNKQVVIMEQAAGALQEGDLETMRDLFSEAFRLDESYDRARFLYAASLIHTGEAQKVDEVISEEKFTQFSLDNFALSAAERLQDSTLVISMLEARIVEQPENAQHRASLASVYHRDGNIEKSIEVLQAAVIAIPSFEKSGSCYIKNLEEGNSPAEGCTG